MRTGDPEINTLDHHIAFFLGIYQGFTNAFLDRIKIYDLTFADAARWSLADADNAQGAVTFVFADDYADLRGANF